MKKGALILLIILGLSCKEKKESNNNHSEIFELNEEQKDSLKIDLKMQKNIIKVLKQQLIEGYGGFYGDTDGLTYKMSKKDLDVTIPIMEQSLKNHGYKFPTDEEFNARIQSAFGRIIDNKINSDYVMIQFHDKCRKEIFYEDSNTRFDIFFPSIYVIKRKNFIANLHPIPTLIDYQKEYPDLAEMERTFNPKEYNKKADEVYLWKDDKDLKQIRDKNIKVEVHRNKYLFNDNNASLTWLMLNDKFFLMDLVKEFGYVEDKELLKWVIDETPIRDSYSRLNIADYLRLFYTTTCDNKLILHQETMDMMVMNDKEKHFNEFKDLISELNRDDSVLDDFTFAKKAKLYAYLFETVRRMRDEDYEAIVTVGGFYDFYNDIFRLAEEFEKNNYYGYTGLKEFLEKAEETGKGTHSGGEY